MVNRKERSFAGIPALASVANPDGAGILQTVGAPGIVANAFVTLDDVEAAVKEEHARATLFYSDRNTESHRLITSMEHILSVVRKHEVLTKYCNQKNDRENVNPSVIDVPIKQQLPHGAIDAIVTNAIGAIDISKETEPLKTATAVAIEASDEIVSLLDTMNVSDLAKLIERIMEKALRPFEQLSNDVNALGRDVSSTQDILKDIRDYLKEVLEALRELQRDVNDVRDIVVRRQRFPFF